MLSSPPSPDHLLECELWKNRCSRLNERRHFALCRLLGVKPAGLEMALLEARTIDINAEVKRAASLWLESENELAHATSLLETAEAIHGNRVIKELDE